MKTHRMCSIGSKFFMSNVICYFLFILSILIFSPIMRSYYAERHCKKFSGGSGRQWSQTNNIAALKVINIDKIDWYFYLHKTTLKVTAVLEKKTFVFLTSPIIFTLFSNAIILWELSVVYHAIWLNIDTSYFRWIGDKNSFFPVFWRKLFTTDINFSYWQQFSIP